MQAGGQRFANVSEVSIVQNRELSAEQSIDAWTYSKQNVFHCTELNHGSAGA
jgi:hypothetical protein